MPDTLSVTGQGKIVNQYLADGTLLRRSFFDKDDNELRRIDYQGEFLFVNGKLDKVFTEEGYYQPASAMATDQSSPPKGGVGGGKRKVKKSDFGTYYYTLKDHLGHTRVVVDEEENVIQVTELCGVHEYLIKKIITRTKLLTTHMEELLQPFQQKTNIITFIQAKSSLTV